MAGEVCVRVAVRVRPLLPKEILHNHQVCVRVVPDSAQVMLGSDRTFSFDHAFGPTEPQDQIYESCVRPLVASLVEGYNATVFAYGQTGSGKTYTLGGGHVASLPEEEEGGIIRRVAQDLFLLLGERGERGEADVGVRVSYVELYREELRDLLELHTSHKELHIREDDRGNTVVVGARETAVSSAEELLSVVEAGDALRHTGSTLMNQRSSRSHAILTLQLGPLRHHHDNHNHAARSSKLHLVDLAGSERAGRTGNTGLRLKESAQINAGLLALGNVIRALSDPRRRRDHHVPYRDAKITRLLRDSLGGHAHTLMVACVSPSHRVIVETLSVLQFAARARHVRNRPEWAGPGPRGDPVGAGPGWDPGEARLGELEQEVQTLREALKERGRGGTGVTDSSKQEVEPERDRSEAEPRYWCLARDAALLLEELPSGVLSGSLSRRLEVWLERHRAVDLSDHSDHCVGEAGDGPHLTVVQLRRELQQCQETLAIDEHVFDQKEAELEEAQREVQTLLQERETHFHALEEEREHRRIQSETLVEQQLLISRLRGDLLTSRTASSGASVEAEASGNPARRPHSVPLISQGHSHEGTRKIHSSPPTCCLERVMAAFRTRSQLLLAQIEERDHVRCPHLTQREERKEGEEEEEGGGRKGFRRSMNRTWTNKQNPACSGLTHQTQPQNTAGLDQNHLNGFQLPQLPELPAGSVGGEETEQHQRLKEAGLRAGHTHRRIQDMSINMRLKEELIKELDKTGKEAEAVDRLYNVDQGKAEPKTNQQQKDTAQLRAQVQQDCGRGVLAGLCERSRAELQHSIDHMRQQREELQLSLRQERETRARLQTSTTHLHRISDPHRTNGTTDLQRNRELRTEDLSVSLNGACEDSEEKQQRLEKRAWLEQEEELVLQRRRGLHELEEELRRREEVLLHREECLKERNQLEMKRLRSSQALSQDLLRVSACLGAVDQELEEGGAGLRGVSVEELRRERESLRQKRDTLDTQLRDGRVLTPQEELALLQLEEAVEAVDAAVEFKNRSIQERRRLLGGSYHTDLSNPAHGDVTRKLRELSLPEASALLVKYFNKVVCLRESERRLQLRCDDLQLQTEEQQGVARDMEAALHRLTLDTDRRLTEQQREHQHSIQLLLQQLREGVSGGSEQAAQAQASEQVAQANEQAAQAQDRLQQLERDLFFYKSSSRELKRKLRELVSSSLQHQAPPPTSRPQLQTQGTIQTSRPQTQGRKEGRKEARHSDGGAEDGLSVQVQRVELAPVRLSRRELRQIMPCDLSAPRGQSTLATSRGSWFLEDSIEAPRNTD